MRTKMRRRIPPPLFPLRRLLDARGVSLDGLARETGISRTSLQSYASGSGYPSWSNLWRIARGLGCSVSDLVAECEREGVARDAS